MTKINSEKKEISYSAEKVFDFITNFQNFENLLPEDRIEDYQYTEDSCSFKIKGMAELGLKIEEKTRPTAIKMKSDGKVPFPFTMLIHLEEKSPESCIVGIDFEGDINPFLKMMVEKPLTNFFNMLVDKLATIPLD